MDDRRLAIDEAPREPTPTVEQFWDEWNGKWRRRDDCDSFMEMQRELAVSVARRASLRASRILDVGCGTGWLAQALTEFGRVWGNDLSASAIEYGARRYPVLTLIAGDFFEVDLPGPFDFIVSADALPHIPDHHAFIRRIALLLRPGGTFLLMTQNPYIWRHRSALVPIPRYLAHAGTDEWPSPARVRELLQPDFVIERETSLDPGGDRGLLWWVENRYIRAGMGRLIGRRRWRSLLERAGLGRDFVVVARRSSGAGSRS